LESGEKPGRGGPGDAGKATVAAFFDIDGTLVGGASVWRGIWDYSFQERRRRDRPIRFLFDNARRAARLARSGASRDEFAAASAEGVGAIFAGLTPAEAQEMFVWIWQRSLRPRLRADVAARLRQHRERGHTVALISATLEGLARLVGEELGADAAVGSALEVLGGRLSGRILPPVCIGFHKAERARELVARWGAVDLSASFAYADASHDAPLLDLVGHPVAVYPDPGLYVLARERGWEVLGTPRPRRG
jgi:HAD superfamily hydrolase (TIGR01490 family)